MNLRHILLTNWTHHPAVAADLAFNSHRSKWGQHKREVFLLLSQQLPVGGIIRIIDRVGVGPIFDDPATQGIVGIAHYWRV